jgi:hypothetical protein
MSDMRPARALSRGAPPRGARAGAHLTDWLNARTADCPPVPREHLRRGHAGFGRSAVGEERRRSSIPPTRDQPIKLVFREGLADAGRSVPVVNNLDAKQPALEAAGVEFTNGGQPGARTKAKPRYQDPEEADRDPAAE